MLKNNYTTKELKILFKDILTEEEQLNNIKIEGYLYTINDYYHSEIFKKKIKLSTPINNIQRILDPINSEGWYDNKEKKIIIILSPIYEHQKNLLLEDIIQLLAIIYHEIRHRHQEELIKEYDEYNQFIMELEKMIINYNELFYLKNHDRFFIEIDADKYALEKIKIKTQEIKNIITINNYLEYLNRKNQNQSLIYSPLNIFEKFNQIVQKQLIKEKNINTLVNNKDYYEKTKEYILSIYKENGNFKNINELLKKDLNPNILKIILSSTPYLNKLDLNILTNTEKDYLKKILETTHKEEIKRQEIISQINEEILYNSQKETIKDIYIKKRIITLNNYLNKI